MLDHLGVQNGLAVGGIVGVDLFGVLGEVGVHVPGEGGRGHGPRSALQVCRNPTLDSVFSRIGLHCRSEARLQLQQMLN